MSAIAGFSNELGFSIYGGAKFALEGVSEAVHGEVAPLGIKVTIVEPGPFRTDFIGRSLARAEHSLDPTFRTLNCHNRLLRKLIHEKGVKNYIYLKKNRFEIGKFIRYILNKEQ